MILINNKHSLGDGKNILDHNSPIPLHYQLTEYIRKELFNGTIVDENGKLPTENELAETFQVSRVTVRSALTTLLNEGLLDRKRGSGTFLKSNNSENWVGELMGFSESFEAAGVQHGAKVLYKGRNNHPEDKIKEQLRTGEVWELRRLRFADGEPIAIEHSYFPIEIGIEISKQKDLNQILTYRFIEQELNIQLHEAKQIVSAVNASRDEARTLNIPIGDALLYTERLSLSTIGEPVEYLQSVYRPDYFQYVVNLKRRR
ncbi:GntR family transcriptional regulator [Bacillus litorisediminis]|uniref:GntR family transcriptional regulator n=1 Tax=Bacillus litorisediminis TaxID=2922713 RepID=UPI001FAD927E|nr:GntR family transcriptional regulator [Bacillus litorisediminis]